MSNKSALNVRKSKTTPVKATSMSIGWPPSALVSIGRVSIKRSCARLLTENAGRVTVLFSAELQELENGTSPADEHTDGSTSLGTGGGEGKVHHCLFEVRAPPSVSPDRISLHDFLRRIQKYVDEICKEGCHDGKVAGSQHGVGTAAAGEDSSYDSDYEADISTPGNSRHEDISRTASDTLAAEYADYVQTDASPGYTARVEFALKLGYTERLVQAALAKLGPTPAQNELLAELIKLGAQRGVSSDSSPSDDVLPALVENHEEQQVQLRPIVIDGSNLAMSHGNKEKFSCRGIKIAVDWFRMRGHKDITVFVPKWRKEAPRLDNPIQDQEILAELERERLLVFTPSRLVGGKRMVCYDDRYILKLAAEVDGVVVSNDNYRDLCQESAEFRKVVEERVLMYSFVNDRFMPPDDPLGRAGPTLTNFLRMKPKKVEPPPLCPYGKKCTYGNKCKYNHPERGPLPHKTVTERLSEHAQRHLQARESETRKLPLGRTRSNVPPPRETTYHTVVSKSRSVDNVGGAHLHAGENLHRKLQRQLTLNPNADPRLRRYKLVPQMQQQQQQQQQQPLPPTHPLQARQSQQQQSQQQPQQQVLNYCAGWEMHQNVTRIASAPDSCRPWPRVNQPCMPHMISSCSDPQLNIWSPHLPTAAAATTLNVQGDARRQLHYHLTAIFPEEQVLQAMQLYPDETNPQKICAVILSMYPKQG